MFWRVYHHVNGVLPPDAVAVCANVLLRNCMSRESLISIKYASNSETLIVCKVIVFFKWQFWCKHWVLDPDVDSSASPFRICKSSEKSRAALVSYSTLIARTHIPQ